MSATAAYLLETLVTLAVVLAVAVGVLVGARRLGVGAPSGPLELLGRLPLDARRAIYLVRVGPQVLVVGASEGGLVKLSELGHDALPPAPPPPGPGGFAAVLARARAAGVRRAGPPEGGGAGAA
ncbi:MAG TPA: flagellar biosynthetic protein FliO [Polyangiaceae bacterium]|nr:flagellar biosynthetic protein FliO [Polyangiaceae bacterium]